MTLRLTLLFTLIAHILFGQKDIKNYVLENTSPITSFDFDQEDYSDLEAIKNSIGDAKVVMLGEQDHGDANTFKMKSRLVKYLHEELGFNIIAFESNFYGMQKNFEEDPQNFEAAKDKIFQIWTKCEECQSTFDYIKDTYSSNQPLYMTGVDVRRYDAHPKDIYSEDFDRFLSDNNIEIEDKKRFIDILDELYKNEYDSKATEKDRSFFFATLKSIDQEYSKDDFMKQELQNLNGYAENSWLINMKKIYSKNSTFQYRDVQMANNLIWLSQKRFPNEKIIVWAANMHTAKSHLKFHSSLGLMTYKTLGNEMYTLGFTSYKGQAGRINTEPYNIRKPAKNSFEQWLSDSKYTLSFTDFTEFKGKAVHFSMKGLIDFPYRMKWTEVYDGVIYIEEQLSCTSLVK
ncbi:erythromycin esterase family protein [Flammeovirga sp. MY04]|uniref:erythromycin esterase family protein n=1 Tax=Flammeovirga sp. MY04 TaxID=1191459 RepID=UPI0008063328|nr:erythromycin esterase family protein [Flammeovirga sp. MY04]ANQ50416.1 erythromycin esterase family protein [Flammeovirga sp. MY04]